MSQKPSFYEEFIDFSVKFLEQTKKFAKEDLDAFQRNLNHARDIVADKELLQKYFPIIMEKSIKIMFGSVLINDVENRDKKTPNYKLLYQMWDQYKKFNMEDGAIPNLFYKFSQMNHKERRILIVGAGPVGLLTAYKFLKYGCKVKLLEIRSEYTREEIFMFQNTNLYETLDYLPEDLFNEMKKRGCFILPPPLDSEGFCFASLKKKLYFSDKVKRVEKIANNLPAQLFSIKIKIFEQIFYEYLQENFARNIQIFRPEKGNAKVHINENNWSVEYISGTLRKNITADDYDVIIGADGARSKVRDKILNDAKNPEGNEGMLKYFVVKNKFETDKSQPKEINLQSDEVKLIQVKVDDKSNIPNLGFALIAYINTENLNLVKKRDELDLTRFGHTSLNLRSIKKIDQSLIDFQNINNTSSTIDSIQNTNLARWNLFNFIPRNTHYVTKKHPFSTQPQHRYRFFSSPENVWYMGVSLYYKEFDTILAIRKQELGGIDVSFRNLRDLSYQFINKISQLKLTLASAFKYYDLDKNEDVENILKNTTISIFPINLYRASYFTSSKIINGQLKICGIVGDAAVGVHYFSGTGVNVGFKMASKMTDKIIETFSTGFFKTNPSLQIDLINLNRNLGNIINRTLQNSINVQLDFEMILDNLDVPDAFKCDEKGKALRDSMQKYKKMGAKGDDLNRLKERCDHRKNWIDFVKDYAEQNEIDLQLFAKEINYVLKPTLNLGRTS
jgi:2-polyprenyl-6-methoxyphenol hydroxylase-like FAD-dependent oxidoreductase